MVAIFSTYSKHEGHVSTGPEVEVRNMFDGTLDARVIGRRSFLRGSALFAAAVGLGVASSAFGQEQQEKPTPADPFAEEEKYGKDTEKETDKEKETKVDKEGREYRSCPQCGSNMYKQGRTWTCENCGYSYVE
jgi:ribosomal protein S27AE